MESLLKDIRYTLRMLGKDKGFTAIAVITLALGIGANTSIFSAINALLLRPLPFKNPDKLMMIYRADTKTNEGLPWSYPKFEVLRDNNSTFEQIAAYSEQSFPLTGTDNPERLKVEMVSASYFPLLGIDAIAGRIFLAEEDRSPDASPVALISHSLWQRRFGSAQNVLGQTISLNKVTFTIVGVLPENYRGQSGNAEVWVPMMAAPSLTFPKRLKSAHAHWHQVIARLKPDANPARAQSEMDLVTKKIEETIGRSSPNEPEGLKVVALREAKIDPNIRRSFLILFAAVGFVLLIACVNISNLLMARSVSRRKEIAVRMAMGASRGRLIRQLLTESICISVMGGLIGLLASLWAIELIASIKPESVSSWTRAIQMLDSSAIKLDLQVLVFNLFLSLVTGIFFGLVPSLQISKTNINEVLKEGSKSSAESAGSLRRLNPRNILVVMEIALTCVLLIGAGLLIKSFAKLQAIPIGFEPDNLLTLKIELPKYKQEASAAFYEQLLSRVSTLPGVQSASVASSTPLSNNSSGTFMTIGGKPPQVERAGTVGVHSVGFDHFKTLRIPILKGRSFTSQDRAGSKRVAIISETAARHYWPDKDPIGEKIYLGVGWEPADELAEIVGIVGDVKYKKVEDIAEPDVYLSYLQPTEPSSFLIARTAVNPETIISAIRQEVLSLDKNVPIFDIKTMEARISSATSSTRFSASLLAVFSAIALLLSTIGIYGVISYAVTARTREIGVRMALGAQQKDVLKLILGNGIILIAAGVLLGQVAAFALTKFLSTQLYGVGATDPSTFVFVPLLLAFIAILASYFPARRATRVDPMVALRYE
jgi:predicted permease